MHDRLIAEIKRRKIPPLYAQENTPDPTIYLEMTLFGFHRRWLVSECEIQDGDVLFFGFINGDAGEWGYFRLSELENTGSSLLVSFESAPLPFSELKRAYRL